MNWVFKRFVVLFYNKEDNENEKSNDTNFFKIFDYFLFFPFVEVIKSIKETHEENNNIEYNELNKKMIECLEKNKNKSHFSQLYNLYKSDRNKCEKNIFKKVVHPKSEILKQIFDLFNGICKGDILYGIVDDKLHIEAPLARKELMTLNIVCQKSLLEYQYDFTLTALKEIIKANADNYNDSVCIALSIKDLIDLQTYFLKLINSPDFSNKNDPLKILLYQINNFKLDELDNTSNIRNFVLKFLSKTKLLCLPIRQLQVIQMY